MALPVRIGATRRTDQTLREGIAACVWRLASPEERALIWRGLQLYEAERFGGQAVEAERKEKVAQALDKLGATLRGRRKEGAGSRAA